MQIELGIVGRDGRRSGPMRWQTKLWTLHRQHRFLVSLVARRHGKTVANLMVVLREAIENGNAMSQYAFVSPTFQQAKQTAWAYLVQLVEEVPGVEVRVSDLTVMLPNGARIILASGENYERLRGLYLDGVVLDEVAHVPTLAWTAVIRPALADRQGWAIFSGTPNGQANLLYSLYEFARKHGGDWAAFRMPASKAKEVNGSEVVADSELEAAALEMSSELYAQEFELSFTAAARGAYYAEQLLDMETEGRFQERIVRDKSHGVTAAADLGWGDFTSVWVAQDMLGEVRVMDFMEDRHKDWAYYLDWMHERGVRDIILPHDAKNHNLAAGSSVLGQTRARKFQTRVLPQTKLQEQLEAVRRTLSRSFFDYPKTSPGIGRLREYRAHVDKLSGTLKPTDVHDDASHAAKAFAYLSLGLRPRALASDMRRDYRDGDGFGQDSGSWMSV